MKPKECPQPFCALQRDGLSQEELIEIGRRLMAGEVVSALRPSPPEESREVCVACVKGIEQGKSPLTWGAEYRGLLGGWNHYRRAYRARNRQRWS